MEDELDKLLKSIVKSIEEKQPVDIKKEIGEYQPKSVNLEEIFPKPKEPTFTKEEEEIKRKELAATLGGVAGLAGMLLGTRPEFVSSDISGKVAVVDALKKDLEKKKSEETDKYHKRLNDYVNTLINQYSKENENKLQELQVKANIAKIQDDIDQQKVANVINIYKTISSGQVDKAQIKYYNQQVEEIRNRIQKEQDPSKLMSSVLSNYNDIVKSNSTLSTQITVDKQVRQTYNDRISKLESKTNRTPQEEKELLELKQQLKDLDQSISDTEKLVMLNNQLIQILAEKIINSIPSNPNKPNF